MIEVIKQAKMLYKTLRIQVLYERHGGECVKSSVKDNAYVPYAYKELVFFCK